MTTFTASRWSQVENAESPRKRPELLPDADEDVLRELVGVAAAGHPAHEAVHARQVRVIHPLERRHVSRRGQRHVVSHPRAETADCRLSDRSGNARSLGPRSGSRAVPLHSANVASSFPAPAWTDRTGRKGWKR